MEKKKEVILLFLLIFFVFAINYRFLDSSLVKFFDEKETAFVERVIDGDTIVVGNGTHVRLLGINTPEKGEKYYSEAKEFLENFILNQSVQLEFGKDKYDRYDRVLAYIFLGEENVNLKLIENGFANFYFPSGKDKYYPSFKSALENCVEQNKNLCEKSLDKCGNCIKLNVFDFENEVLVFENNCKFDCDLTGWRIKDEGRKNFVFENFSVKGGEDFEVIVGNETDSERKLFWKGEDYVWTDSGDTLFLRDEEGKLILWESY